MTLGSNGAVQQGPVTLQQEGDLVPVDTVYRRYFLGAILLTLSAGAGWGAWLLWQIGSAGSFTGVSVHELNAHGQAQIYGWVGLFIMGFAYQGFPRLWRSRPAKRWISGLVFVLMTLGVVLRTIGMAAQGSGGALDLALLGGGLQVLAIGLFIGQMIGIWRASEVGMTAQVAFVLGALLFFAIQALWDNWHTYMTMTAGSQEELVWYISTYQGPLRDLQIHGLALFMIFGVSLLMLPRMFHLPRIPTVRAWWGFGVLLVAVIGETALFIAYRYTDRHVLAALLLVPWALLAVGYWLIVAPWRPWRAMPVPNRSGKFVRAAFGWLAVAIALLLLMPVYLWISGLGFSHAYYGAIRHAITVGFISMMIVGISALAVPRITGIDPRGLSALWGPFVLLNVGCLLRVSLQALTDWHPMFFAWVGVSGVLEVVALAWWGWHLHQLIRRGDGGPANAIPADTLSPARALAGRRTG